jgi:CheY-like chemotaxis protein
MSVVGLSEDALFRLHPAAIRISQALAIRSFGPIASAYAPKMRSGLRLQEFFDVVPELQDGSLSTLAAAQLPLQLVSKEQGIRLAGVVFATGPDFLIVANPTLSEHIEPYRTSHIPTSFADDLLVRSLVHVGLLPSLTCDANWSSNDLRLEWEGNDNSLDQLTGFVAHEFSNLLSIILLNCERLLSLGATEFGNARTIGLIQETARRGGSVSKWLRALSGNAELSHREPLDDFLEANLALLETLCGPNVVVSSQLQTAGASLDAPSCGLLTCLVNLVRMVAVPSKKGIRANISTMLTNAPDSDQPMAQIKIRIEADEAIEGADLVTSRHRQLMGHHKAHASIFDFASSVGGAAHHEFVEENAAIVTLLIPCINETELDPDVVVAAIDSAAAIHRHLIVVEDEPAALEALVELLEYEGFAVSACGNAEEALAALAEHPDAILVTDVVLPTIDGLTLAKAATLANPLLKVVIMSGHIPDQEHSDQRWAFLQKPLDVDALVAAIVQANE